MTEPTPLPLEEVQAAFAGTWSLERELGRGGMGTVFLARDVSLDRPVAIKVLHPALAADADARARFLREARTGARLSHPHIVPILSVDELGGFVFFVMGLVDGEPLGARIRREGPLRGDEAERILRETGWALGYAHAMGIVHRDVTLENILVERHTGRAMLADFGIAAAIDHEGDGPLLGTPAYLAPELVTGGMATPASDLYALCVTAWTMLAGRLPFDGGDSAATLLLHVSEPVPSLASAAPGASARLVRAIEHGLGKDPALRDATIEAWLARFDRGSGATALAAPLARWVRRDQRIRPAWAFAMPMIGGLSLRMVTEGVLMQSPFFALTVIAISAAVVIAPTALLQLAFEARELRLALRAGYGIEDLRLAMRREALAAAPQGPPPLLARLMRDVRWVAVGAIVVLLHLIQLAPYLIDSWSTYYPFLSAVGDVFRWVWILFWTGIGAAFVLPTARAAARLPGRGLLARFWNSRGGEWFARLAGWGLRRVQPVETTLHRPTELVLDLAIDDLLAAMPPARRADFGELSLVAGALRRRVAEVRQVREHLAQPSMRRTTEVTALDERLAAREAAGITALERLRLHLARLTLQGAPVGEFTQQLEGARALEMELLEELGAHRALRRVLPGVGLTPTPGAA